MLAIVLSLASSVAGAQEKKDTVITNVDADLINIFNQKTVAKYKIRNIKVVGNENFDENLYGAEQMKASYKRQPQETIEVEGNVKSKGNLKSKQQGADKSSSINKATKILNTLESVESKTTKIINEDLQKMMNLISYNRKTQ